MSDESKIGTYQGMFPSVGPFVEREMEEIGSRRRRNHRKHPYIHTNLYQHTLS
jgi:hypothetical protein